MSATTATAATTATRAVISGFHNYTEAQQALFGTWKKILGVVFSRHGFVQFNPRPAELKASLQTGGIGHEVYQINRMTDGQETELALPFDRTVPLANWISEHAKEIVFPFKRQHIDISWRAERPQSGRLRAFYQADVDMVGPKLGPLADAECFATIFEAVEALGFNDFRMSLNHMSITRGMLKPLNLSEENVTLALREIDKLDKLPEEKVVEEILKIDPNLQVDAVKTLVSSLNFRGSINDFILREEWGQEAVDGLAALKDLFRNLETLGIDIKRLDFCPGLARGLAYYTGPVFETHLKGGTSSIASGGRFDKLVQGLGEGELPGVGGSIGLSRLFDIHMKALESNPEEAEKVLRKKSDADCVVLFHQDADMEKGIQIAKTLREKGLNVELYTEGSTMKLPKKLEYANKKGIPLAVMAFSDDVSVRNMEAGTQEKYASEDEAIAAIIALKRNEAAFAGAV